MKVIPTAPKTGTVDRKRLVKGEIEGAIDLHFRQQSAIAVHVLCWAAIDVMRTLIERSGKQTFFSAVEIDAPKTNVHLFRKLIRQAYNFAKHSDRDPDAEIPFSADFNHGLIMVAIADYKTLFSTSSMPMLIFTVWLANRHPELLTAGGALPPDVLSGLELFRQNTSLVYASQVLDEVRSKPEALAAIILHQGKQSEIEL